MALTAALLMAGGAAAGVFGALLGIGGGILIVPLLTFGFGQSLTAAVGTSLICVIATSSGAAAHYVRSDRADVRLGVVLEIATALGGIAGGVLAGILLEQVIAGLFAMLMYYTAFTLARGGGPGRSASATGRPASPGAPDGASAPTYRSTRLAPALGASFLAGNVASLLGVGGGVIKVPVIHLMMGAPMQVAVATSNLAIGVTAAAGSFFYIFRGQIDPLIAGPVVLGVFAGAFLGARLTGVIRQRWLTMLFVLVVFYVAVQMTARALGGVDVPWPA